MENNPQHFDVIIVGGGINGAGIARETALRGLKTLILDKNDFAFGTSSRSTKLIHGGIRYLENYQFKLVWEACHERKILTKIAPHLVKPVPFIIPAYKGDARPLWLIRLGMTLYDLMAGFKNIKRHRGLSAGQIRAMIPSLNDEGLKGGGLYYDCRTNDSRLTLANITDAVRHGAAARNYTEVYAIKAHERGLEVFCQDILTGEKSSFTTGYLVNATGPWLDRNEQKWYGKSSNLLRLTKGIHFFIPVLTADYAVLITAKKDNRVFFVIPHGQYSLVGTTDTDFKQHPDSVEVGKEDLEYLLAELNRLFPSKLLTPDDVHGPYAGLRPLLNTEGVKEGSVTREYQLKEEKRGESVILNVIGGKITTYRNLAEKVGKRIEKYLKGKTSPSITAANKLPGGIFPHKTFEQFKAEFPASNPRLKKLPSDITDNLLDTYGSEIVTLLPYLDNGAKRIIQGNPVIWEQLYYGIDHEFIRTAEDFIKRRSELYLDINKQPELADQINAIVKTYGT